VIEEVENGLHPEMAARVVSLVRRQSEKRSIRTLVTTHSPALLDALEGADHRGVIVCDRHPGTGASRLTRLVDLPGYPTMMARGTLGDVVGRGLLAEAATERPRCQHGSPDCSAERDGVPPGVRPRKIVEFVDTSVLLEILDVPGEGTATR